MLFPKLVYVQENPFANLFDEQEIEFNQTQLEMMIADYESESAILEKDWLANAPFLDAFEQLSYGLINNCKGENEDCLYKYLSNQIDQLNSIRESLQKNHSHLIAKSITQGETYKNNEEKIVALTSALEIMYRGIIGIASKEKLSSETKFDPIDKEDLNYSQNLLDNVLTEQISSKKGEISTFLSDLHTKYDQLINTDKWQPENSFKTSFDRILKLKDTSLFNPKEFTVLLLQTILLIKKSSWKEIVKAHKTEFEGKLVDEFTKFYDSITPSSDSYSNFIKSKFFFYRNYFRQLGITNQKIEPSKDSVLIEISLEPDSLKSYAKKIFKIVSNEGNAIERPEIIFDALHYDYNSSKKALFQEIKSENDSTKSKSKATENDSISPYFLRNFTTDSYLSNYLKQSKDLALNTFYLKAIGKLIKPNIILDTLLKDVGTIKLVESPTLLKINKSNDKMKWKIERRSVVQLRLKMLSGYRDSIIKKEPLYWEVNLDTVVQQEKIIKAVLNYKNIDSALKYTDTVFKEIENFEENLKAIFTELFGQYDNQILSSIKQIEKQSTNKDAFDNYVSFNSKFTGLVHVYWSSEPPQIEGHKLSVKDLVRELKENDIKQYLIKLISERFENLATAEIESLKQEIAQQIKPFIGAEFTILNMMFEPYHIFEKTGFSLRYKIKYKNNAIGTLTGSLSNVPQIKFDEFKLNSQSLFELFIESNAFKNGFIEIKNIQQNPNTTTAELFLNHSNENLKLGAIFQNEAGIKIEPNQNFEFNFHNYLLRINQISKEPTSFIVHGKISKNQEEIGVYQMKLGKKIIITTSSLSDTFLKEFNKEILPEQIQPFIRISSLMLAENQLKYNIKINDDTLISWLEEIFSQQDIVNTEDLASIFNDALDTYMTVSEIIQFWEDHKEKLLELALSKIEDNALAFIEEYITSNTLLKEQRTFQISSGLALNYQYDELEDNYKLDILIGQNGSKQWLIKAKKASLDSRPEYQINRTFINELIGQQQQLLEEQYDIQFNYSSSNLEFVLKEAISVQDTKADLIFQISLDGKISWENEEEILLLFVKTNSFDFEELKKLFPSEVFLFKNVRPIVEDGTIQYDIEIQKEGKQLVYVKDLLSKYENEHIAFELTNTSFDFSGLRGELNDLNIITVDKIKYVPHSEPSKLGSIQLDYNMDFIGAEKMKASMTFSLIKGEFDFSFSQSLTQVLFNRIKAFLDANLDKLKFDFNGIALDYIESNFGPDSESLVVDFSLYSEQFKLNCLSNSKISFKLNADGKLEGPDISEFNLKDFKICLQKELEKELAGILAKAIEEWGSIFENSPISVKESQLVYKDFGSIKLPVGVKLYSMLKIYGFIDIGLPPVLFDFNTGLSVEDLDRLAFEIKHEINIPPFALTDLGGELSENFIKAKGKITLLKSELKNVIYSEGAITIPLKDSLVIEQSGKLVLLKFLVLAESTNKLGLKPKIYFNSKYETGKILEGILQFEGTFDIDDKININGKIDEGKFLGVFEINGNLEINLEKESLHADVEAKLLGVTSKGELIILTKPSFYLKLLNEISLRVKGHRISSVKTFVEPYAAGVNFNFMGMDFGATVPSYKSLNKDLIWNLIKDLLTVEFEDVFEMTKAILSGNINVNPFSDFGSKSDGISANGAKSNDSTKSHNRPANENFQGDGFNQVSVSQLAAFSQNYDSEELKGKLENNSRKEGDVLKEIDKNGIVRESLGATEGGQNYTFSFDAVSKTWDATASNETIKNLDMRSVFSEGEYILPKNFGMLRRIPNSGVVGFHDASHIYLFSKMNKKGLKIKAPTSKKYWDRKSANTLFYLVYDNAMESIVQNYTLPNNCFEFFESKEGDFFFRTCNTKNENGLGTDCYTFMISSDLKSLYAPPLNQLRELNYETENKNSLLKTYKKWITTRYRKVNLNNIKQ